MWLPGPPDSHQDLVPGLREEVDPGMFCPSLREPSRPSACPVQRAYVQGRSSLTPLVSSHPPPSLSYIRLPSGLLVHAVSLHPESPCPLSLLAHCSRLCECILESHAGWSACTHTITRSGKCRSGLYISGSKIQLFSGGILAESSAQSLN